MMRLTSQFIMMTSPSPITMGEAIVSNKYKRLQSRRVYVIAGVSRESYFGRRIDTSRRMKFMFCKKRDENFSLFLLL